MVTRTSNDSSNQGSAAKTAYKDKPVLGYLNVGKRIPTGNEDKTVQLAPWFGLEVKAEPARKGLSPQAKALHQLVLQKLEGLQPGETVKLNLEVELTKPSETTEVPADVLADFAKLINL